MIPRFLISLCCIASFVNQAAARQEADLGEITERHVMIPMRDGKRLSAYLFFPPGKDLRWPAVFEQRYGGLRGAATRKAAAKLAESGYVVALVNFRGAQQSEGTWVGYRALAWGELQDGFDTCEWLAKQPWCTGKIGTFGSSQGGYAQNFLAVTRPPHLVCQYMTDTGLSLFQEGYRIGGTTRPERFKGMDANCRVPEHNRRLLAEWFRHPHYDDYWRDEDCSLHFDKMNVPCFTIGSWYDFMNQGSILSFQGRQHRAGPNSRGKQQIVIGPWLHGRRNKGNRVGQLVYPENAAWPVDAHMVRWFDHWLKGKKNGVMDEPTVRYYVMGAVGEEKAPGNVWRTTDDWPPPARSESMYLRAGGRLTTTKPNGDPAAEDATTSYASDPRQPMRIPGRSFPGARDARAFEKQSDVRTFTTEPLKEPVEWTGRVRAELFVSSTAADTDFIVRVSDVYPDGRSILIVDYPFRARYREGFEKEVLMTPGKVHKVAFDVGWLSQIFNKGHRIRVTVASTGEPLYEPNPQTGKPLTIEFPDDAIKATNTVHHHSRFASRIIAPVARPSRGKSSGASLRRIQAIEGSAAAVIVKGRRLLHTTQLSPRETKGDLRSQLASALSKLDVLIKERRLQRSDVVKLNLYGAAQVSTVAAPILSEWFGMRPPAVSFVQTRLPKAGAKVALDAVIAARNEDPLVLPAMLRVAGGDKGRQANLSLTPRGDVVYVAGQAQRGDLRQATAATLEGLLKTLRHMRLDRRHIVQVKCFLAPMTKVDIVNEEIDKFFGELPIPPVSHVEWIAGSLPIEIEVVAFAPRQASDSTVSFVTPPWMKSSPVFSRVARIHGDERIYVSGLYSKSAGDGEAQVRNIFGSLRGVLKASGSDMRHLAKATYYVSDAEASSQLNKVRPEIYDPLRPPSASKAMVHGVGKKDRGITIDMIAAPN